MTNSKEPTPPATTAAFAELSPIFVVVEPAPIGWQIAAYRAGSPKISRARYANRSTAEREATKLAAERGWRIAL